MAMPRLDGGTSFTTAWSISSVPEVIDFQPADERGASVDLPQPEGPTKTMNSPDVMSRLTSFRMWTAP